MTVSADVAALLREDWAEIPELSGVRVLASQRDLDRITQTTALLRWQSTEREPSAPMSTRRIGVLLTLISPSSDLDAAGEELEALTEAVLDYLGTRFQHGPATVAAWSESNLAVDIPLTILAN